MLLRLVQIICGVLACIMCIFILGPIAMIIELVRIAHSWILQVPTDYTNFRAVYPMFVTFVTMVATIFVLAQI